MFEFFSFSRLFLWISVVQITVFYIVLYAFLAGFFIALLTVFYQTLNDHEPKWTMGSSLIGNSPGESIKFYNCSWASNPRRHLVTPQDNSIRLIIIFGIFFFLNYDIWLGMGYRPTHADPDVTVISFNAKEPKYWSDRVDDFLGRKLFHYLF